jgi:hypothetical protein
MILGAKVKIKYVSKEMYNDEQDLLDGAFDASALTIYISTRSDIQATLLHECLHAAIWISGAGNLINHKTEETLVSAIENALKQYFHIR